MNKTLFLLLFLALSCQYKKDNTSIKSVDPNKKDSTTYDGIYTTADSNSCNIKLTIAGNRYHINSTNKNQSGKLSIIKKDNKIYLKFEKLLSDTPKIDMEAMYEDQSIIIQNYGNVMNDYLKFSECEEKYLSLKKNQSYTKPKDKILPPLDSLLGDWRVNCNEGSGFLQVKHPDTIIFEINSNQIYILAHSKSHNNNKTINLYLTKPLELGAGGMRLSWESYSTQKPIATIKYKENNIYLLWLGFFNKSTNQYEWTNKTDWSDPKEKNKEIILMKCEE